MLLISNERVIIIMEIILELLDLFISMLVGIWTLLKKNDNPPDNIQMHKKITFLIILMGILVLIFVGFMLFN